MPLHLDLFSGIGGFSLASGWANYTTIGFCEVDPFCRRVLAKHWPGVPIHGDIRTLTGEIVSGWAGGRPVDLITGGFPCQPVSVAGKRMGKEDDRYLWPEMLRVIAGIRPHRVLGENVAGIVTMGLDAVLSDLESLGYTCRPVVIPAAAVGAPHRRDRVWILADAERGKGALPETFGGEGAFGAGSSRADVADSHGKRLEGSESFGERIGIITRTSDTSGPANAPDPHGARREGHGRTIGASAQFTGVSTVGGGERRNGPEALGGMGDTADGLPGRVARSGWRVGAGVLNPWSSDWEAGCSRVVGHETDRVNKLKALGNAIVPQVAYEILHAWEAA